MSDIRTQWMASGRADYSVAAGGLEVDDGLQTAVVISLFTDRRATDDDIAAGLADEPRGWWADGLAQDGDRIGSRLWLLHRAKATEGVVQRAREYALEALQWLVDDGVVERISVVAEAQSGGVLALSVELYRSRLAPVKYRFNSFWGGI